MGDAFTCKFLPVFSFCACNFSISMSFVSSQHQKRANAQLEHLAREAEIETNRRRLEILELRRLERWQFKGDASDSR